MKHLTTYLISIATLVLAIEMHAVVRRHDVSDGLYQSLAGQEAFASSGLIEYSTERSSSFATGALISPNWVLTAGHIFDTTSENFTLTYSVGSEIRSGSSIHYNPAWLESPNVGLSQGADLALVRLGNPINSVNPVPLINSPVPTGSIAIFSGFGNSGNGLTGANGSLDGQRRAAMNIIDRSYLGSSVDPEANGRLLVTDFDSSGVFFNTLNQPTASTTFYNSGFTNPLLSEILIPDASATSQAGFTGLETAGSLFSGLPLVFLEGTTASGDSGAPLYTQDSLTGEWFLSGITSWGTNPLYSQGQQRQASSYGDLSFFTDVYENRNWIQSIIPEHASYTQLAGFTALLLLFSRRAKTR